MKLNELLTPSVMLRVRQVTMGLISLSSLCVAVALFIGGVSFSNPLPSNPFDYDGIFIIFIFPFQIIATLYAIKFAVSDFINTDVAVVTRDKDGNVVDKDYGEGCMYQLMMVLGVPILAYVLTYVIVYYILYFLFAIGAFIMPYLLLLVMIALCVWYYLNYIKGYKDGQESFSAPVDNSAEQTSEDRERKVGILARVILFVERNKTPIISLLLSILYLMIAILFLNAGFGSSSSNDSDSVVERIANGTEKRLFMADHLGFGEIRLGAVFSKVSTPDDFIFNTIEPCNVGYNLKFNDEFVAEVQVDENDGKIFRITIYTERALLGNGLHVGMPISEALSKEGVTAVVASNYYDDGYVLEVMSGNMLIFPVDGIEYLSQEGMDKLNNELTPENPSVSLTAEDFKPEAKVMFFEI